MTDQWAVRIGADEPTGFGEDGILALEVYDTLVEKAGKTGVGGDFYLLKNGEVVGSATIPPRGGPKG